MTAALTHSRLEELASAQGQVLSRTQLRTLGIGRNRIRNQVAARRWAEISPTVVALTTGELSTAQRHWAAVLHAGPPAALSGLTALEVAGLAGWARPLVSVAIPKSDDRIELDGVDYVETRRDLTALTASASAPPRLSVEAAALLFAAYERSERTAVGLLAATVQQKLTTPDRLSEQLRRMRPLRRAPLFRDVLQDIAGGAQSGAEIAVARLCRVHGLAQPDRQTPRRDRSGRRRYTDNEWVLPERRPVVLEVDGAFHTDVEHWWADMAREREIVVEGRVVLRCSTVEIRLDPERIIRDLLAAGVPRVASSG